MSTHKNVVLGWDAPSLAAQLPEISAADAEHFERDNEDAVRLAVRGYLTSRQVEGIRKKIARNIRRAAISKATQP